MAVLVETYSSLEEASRAVQAGRDTRILGGGTMLMAAVNAGNVGFDRIVRITDPALQQITNEGGSVRIGAGVTMSQIIASNETDFLASAARAVGSPAIRNMGTVGGNLFARPPYGDFTVALLALDAGIHFAGQSGGAMRIDDFLRDRNKNRGRIVAAISVPRPASRAAFRFAKVSRVKPKGAAVLSIAANLAQSGRGVRVAFGNMGPTPLRSTGAERALEGRAIDQASIEQAAASALDGLQPQTDALASEWYRREIAPVHLRRLLLDHAG